MNTSQNNKNNDSVSQRHWSLVGHCFFVFFSDRTLFKFIKRRPNDILHWNDWTRIFYITLDVDFIPNKTYPCPSSLDTYGRCHIWQGNIQYNYANARIYVSIYTLHTCTRSIVFSSNTFLYNSTYDFRSHESSNRMFNRVIIFSSLRSCFFFNSEIPNHLKDHIISKYEIRNLIIKCKRFICSLF